MLIFTDNAIKIMMAKSSWDTILKYIQFNYDKTINKNAVYIMQKITKYIFLSILNMKIIFNISILLFYSKVLNFKTILTDELILMTHRRLCRPLHDIETCNYCERRNDFGMKIIKDASSTFESQFAEGMMISKMNDSSSTNLNERLLISITVPLVIQS